MEERGEINIAFTQGPWKAIWNVQPDTWELYQLDEDPGERQNLASEYPDRVAQFVAAAQRELDVDWDALLAKLQKVGPRDDDAFDEETQKNIEALGYI